MRSLPTVFAPSRRASGAGSALPMVAAALGFGAGANVAVGCLVAAVVAASRTVTLDLSSAALRLAADAGLGLATGLAVTLLAVLAALAGHCSAHGLPRLGASAGRFCRAAVPAAAGASAGLLVSAWLLAQVVGFAEGGTAHALGVLEPSTVVLIGLAFGCGALSRTATAAAGTLAGQGRRLGRILQRPQIGSHPTRFAALATLSVAVLTVCGLVLGWSTTTSSPEVAGAKPLIRPVSGCPGGAANRPRGACTGDDCQPAARPAVSTGTGQGSSPRQAS